MWRGAILVMLVGCVVKEDHHFSLSLIDQPIAVGGDVSGSVVSESCQNDVEGAPDCSRNPVSTVSIDVAPAGVFSATGDAATFVLQATAAGSATLTIIAEDGTETNTFTRTLTAMAINRITAAPADVAGTPCMSPYAYGPSLTAPIPSQLWHDTTQLWSGELNPFQATGAAVDAFNGEIKLITPATSSSGSITSASDPAFALPFTVFTLPEVTAIKLGTGGGQLQVGGSADLSIGLDIAGATSCYDGYEITITSTGPCQFSDTSGMVSTLTGAGWHSVRVYALGTGTCTIEVRLSGTSIVATTSIPIG